MTPEGEALPTRRAKARTAAAAGPEVVWSGTVVGGRERERSGVEENEQTVAWITGQPARGQPDRRSKVGEPGLPSALHHTVTV